MSVVAICPRVLAWFSCADGVITGEAQYISNNEILWLSRIGEYELEKHRDMERFSDKIPDSRKEHEDDFIRPPQ